LKVVRFGVTVSVRATSVAPVLERDLGRCTSLPAGIGRGSWTRGRRCRRRLQNIEVSAPDPALFSGGRLYVVVAGGLVRLQQLHLFRWHQKLYGRVVARGISPKVDVARDLRLLRIERERD